MDGHKLTVTIQKASVNRLKSILNNVRNFV